MALERLYNFSLRYRCGFPARLFVKKCNNGGNANTNKGAANSMSATNFIFFERPQKKVAKEESCFILSF